MPHHFPERHGFVDAKGPMSRVAEDFAMTLSIDRRHFLGTAAAAGVAAGLAAAPAAAGTQGAAGPNQRLVVGIMGTGGRGTGLASSFQQQPNVEVGYVCDPDRSRADRAADAVRKAGGANVRAVADFRRILDDRAVDILVCAACNHWHAPATILACAAGKHVYVEKPCSYNPREGELAVQAAHKHKRLVQMGNQRRSSPRVIEAIEEVRKGTIGRAYLAQSWYLNVRPSIGRGKEASVPAGLDYDLWQGPAPHRPYHTNYLHYNWHWFWHWGNGELGNNGIHVLDLCRWGLNVDFPIRVTSSGGRYRFQDDQETPDTHFVAYDFPGRKTVTWEGLSCNRLPGVRAFSVVFVGENGSLVIEDTGYKVYDPAGKELRAVAGRTSDADHIRNFLDAVRGNGRLTSEIDEAHKSTLLCHLGNIAHRVGRALECDSRDGHIVHDKQAAAYWTREYAKGWEPRV
jgi:predicted dehydrogenase